MLSRRSLCASVIALSICLFAITRGRADEKPDAKPSGPKIAHLHFKGSPSEMPTSDDPLFGGLSESFADKLARIRTAKDDKDVKGLYLYLDGLSVGWGKLNEISSAVEQFRASGRKAIAYVEGGSAMDYAVALSCDEICMPEASWLLLVGMRMEISFYKELFEMIDVKADFLQMGDFKGAAEPYTRSSMSPELRQQLTIYLDDAYENGLVARIAKARGLKPEQVKKIIDNGPYTPKAAKKVGLIDHVLYPNEVQGLLKKQLKDDKLAIAKDYGKKTMDELDLSNPLNIIKMLTKPPKVPSKEPKVAVIHVVGTITTGKSSMSILGGETAGSTTIVKAIEQAAKDETVKAIVLRVDSPGGSALASDLIWDALKKSGKPVIASMGDVAASGGYYVSMSANKIYCEPGTLTGSIGVVGGKLALGGTFKKIGITTDVLSHGKNSGVLSTETPFSDSERKAMRKMMEDVYDQFLSKALAGRKSAGLKMTMDDLKKLAGGRIWTGRQAKANGLIDELGTLDDAIKEAQKLAKMDPGKTPELLLLPKKKSILDSLFEDFPGLSLPASKMTASPLLGEVTKKVGSLESLLRLKNEPVWAILPYQVKLK